MELCPPDPHYPWDVGPPLTTTCKSIDNKELATIRDVDEYPRAGEPIRPPAGSLFAAHSKDNAICGSFSAPFGAFSLPAEASQIEPAIQTPDDVPPEYDGRKPISKLVFDINNDGKKEVVYVFEESTTFRQAEFYFVDAESNGKFDVVLPNYWVGGSDDTNYTILDGTGPWWEPELPTFATRYMHLRPFQLQGTTYFLVSSAASDTMHWFVILRIQNNYQATTMCVFQIVQEHY